MRSRPGRSDWLRVVGTAGAPVGRFEVRHCTGPRLLPIKGNAAARPGKARRAWPARIYGYCPHCPAVRILTAAALALALSAPVLATPPAKPARLGLCAACHGEDGMARIPGAPNLAGQKLDYLREALRQYRDGRRDIPVMRAATGPLTDAELDQLAQWFSAQTPSRAAP